MALVKMQDIGGCRAVCADIAQLRRLEQRVRRSRPPVSESDYIDKPKPSGYRAVHLVVEYDGRLIEIQLRTGQMDEWAVVQERVGDWIGTDLKSGKGPSEVLELMKLLSVAITLEEQSESIDKELVNEIKTTRQKALSFLRTHLPRR